MPGGPQRGPALAKSPLALGFEENEAFDLEFSDEEELPPPAEKKIPRIPVAERGRGQQSSPNRGAAKKKKAPAHVVSIRDHGKGKPHKRGGSHRKTG